ncbi:type II toxin-antitoxin system Phd/YefM family antitoxin [Haliea atlantica]|jgi:antitoxin YefM|nr:type II toxin-antitoxin system prevent-host-death family antitoxin [Haliea sp.]MAL94697.1 type II toxin-antitoxin system prevent-host-death family antitoxin [Haliea sp.]|tara:strand:+ start:1206 stop:1460 length:255 start_codon:yes stop_codon:yes gene_type:complete
MDAMSYSAFRRHLASVLDRVNDDRKPVLITRQTGRPAVLVSLDDYQAWEEMAHLTQSPANTASLNRAVEAIAAGEEVQGDLFEL